MENARSEYTDPISDNDESQAFLATLGQRVRQLRNVRGMSRKMLAQISGISERYLAQLESGSGNLSITLLRRVAEAVDAPVEELICDMPFPQDWPILRELLMQASDTDRERVRLFLSREDDSAVPVTRPRVAVSRIALIGMRGAGKRALGRKVAERLGWQFIEIKQEIETIAGLPVAEIFRLYGSEGHRRFEQKALATIAKRPGPMIVAATSGIVANRMTFENLLVAFFSIWLRAKPEELINRVREQGEPSSMMDGDCSALDELMVIAESREPLYSRARAILNTSERG
ncbi:MAG: helix-turn-helix transcriptional regulator, partial [Alphaproteobacteria bacterium]